MATHHDKKTFLQQGSALYAAMVELAGHDIIRRYLAARIIVNGMAFEDLINDRREPKLRNTRDVLLAHKQEPRFFESYRAFEDIKRTEVDPLLQLMQTEAGTLNSAWEVGELQSGAAEEKFKTLIPQVFKRYEDDFVAGHRVINNPLGATGSSVQEVSNNELAGVFYRYNAAKAFFEIAQRIFNSAHPDTDLRWTTRHAKLDLLLHAQNMADSTFRDQNNSHSIDGLLEVMTKLPMGDASSLSDLSIDPTYQGIYSRVRKVRNKLIAHMDKAASLGDLINQLDQLPYSIPFDLANAVEMAVRTAAFSHPAIRMRYALANQQLDDPNIVGISGQPPASY